jgi:threonine dehydrogenase-like Zn-dependent dehydrogenase
MLLTVDSNLFDPNVFYSRQIVLPELGRQSQEKLRKSRVAVIGVGGLGSASALYLALAGVGFIRLVDQDTVEMHNLHRQVLYALENIRYPKVEAAAQRIRNINPDVELDPIPENVREDNVEELISGVDVVVDGLDNMKTRYLINEACAKHGSLMGLIHSDKVDAIFGWNAFQNVWPDTCEVIELPPELQVFRSTVVAMISYTKNAELSQEFIDFLTSKEVRKIYSNWGWIHK